LRVPTYLAPSGIHGVGVFTPEFIPAGSVIWTFDPEVDWTLSADDVNHFPEAYRPKIRAYCYLDESGVYILCGDNARFMNHSEEPNCDDWTSRSTLAWRDIQAGEELTCDYRAFDLESRDERAEDYVRRTA
jgi:SET domain-containing protein